VPFARCVPYAMMGSRSRPASSRPASRTKKRFPTSVARDSPGLGWDAGVPRSAFFERREDHLSEIAQEEHVSLAQLRPLLVCQTAEQV
jgi:hypothetical protein